MVTKFFNICYVAKLVIALNQIFCLKYIIRIIETIIFFIFNKHVFSTKLISNKIWTGPGRHA